ncbi:MAG TPA: DUF1192 domain-containing protein [Alphaproteobacteria bacterium]|nr:DUF1192 domain-containing protein [Alphaproteobacteria bacterium]
MDIEDLEPRKTKPKPKNLDPLSVDELEDYIRELEAEIARVKGEIAKKSAHLNAAAAFFKPSSGG